MVRRRRRSLSNRSMRTGWFVRRTASGNGEWRLATSSFGSMAEKTSQVVASVSSARASGSLPSPMTKFQPSVRGPFSMTATAAARSAEVSSTWRIRMNSGIPSNVAEEDMEVISPIVIPSAFIPVTPPTAPIQLTMAEGMPPLGWRICTTERSWEPSEIVQSRFRPWSSRPSGVHRPQTAKLVHWGAWPGG